MRLEASDDSELDADSGGLAAGGLVGVGGSVARNKMGAEISAGIGGATVESTDGNNVEISARSTFDVESDALSFSVAGLVGGVGSVLKDHAGGIRIIGCQPLASPVMARSVAAGKIVELPSEPTLSDGTAGGIEPDAITFELDQAVVDDWVEVDEEQIAAAMRLYMDSEGDIVEGAAGVAVAGLLDLAGDVAGKKVVVVICGGNVSDEVLEAVRQN